MLASLDFRGNFAVSVLVFHHFLLVLFRLFFFSFNLQLDFLCLKFFHMENYLIYFHLDTLALQ